MSIERLIRDVSNKDIYLYVEDNKLKYKARSGDLSKQLRDSLKAYKNEIIAYLNRDKLSLDNSLQTIPKIDKLQTDASNHILLSHAQQRLWFLDQYMGPSAVYNIPLALCLRGTLKVDILLKSLTKIVHRHEALRTRFESIEGKVIQVIDPPDFSLTLELIPSTHEVQTITQSERGYLFNLSKDKLCRIRLLKDEEKDSHALLITMHHSVSDGWSQGVFFNELISLYSAFKNGKPSPLPPLPIQYADYACWQREWLSGEVLANQLNYWQKQLRALPPLLTLPTDRPRPEEQTFRGSSIPVMLSTSLSSRLQSLSQIHDVTLYMTLLSGFSILMSCYSGQKDIAIGSPIANRTRRETEGLIGFFVNTLVMRCKVSADLSFTDFLQQVRETTLQAYVHQDIPFEMLVETLNPERSLNHSPLFQVIFSLQNIPAAATSLSDLDFSPLIFSENGHEEGVARFDLSLALSETAGGIMGSIEYNTDLFDRTTIERLMRHYELLLDALIESQEEPISNIQFLSEPEQLQQSVKWNAALANTIQHKCIHTILEEQVETTPDTMALVFDKQNLSYSELNNSSNKLAHYLIEKGIGPENRIGIYVENLLGRVTGTLGVLKAGGCYVPLNTSSPRQRLQYLIEDSGVELIIMESSLQISLLFETDATPNISCVALDGDWRKQYYAADNPIANTCASSVASIIYPLDHRSESQGIEILHHYLSHRFHSINTLGIDWEKSLLVDMNDWPGTSETSLAHYILSEHRTLLPHGVVGELYISGDVLSRGYRGSVRLTAERFLPNPISTNSGSRIYRTGKPARYLADGTIELVGHLELKEQKLKCNLSMEAHKIEQVLRQHRELKDAAVVLKKNNLGLPLLVAYVVKVTTTDVDADICKTLNAHLRSQFILYQLPSAIVVLKTFPLTAEGQLDERALPDAKSLNGNFTPYVAPRNDTEKSLCEIWQNILDIKQIGIHDNFFELGGSSLKAASLTSQISSILKKDIALTDFFKQPTIEELGKYIEGDKESPLSTITPLPHQEYYDIFDLQKVGYLTYKFKNERRPFNTMNIMSYQDFDKTSFEKSMELLVRRHEVFRTTFHTIEGIEKQKINTYEETPNYMEPVDLRHVENQEHTIRKHIIQCQNKFFDLETGPLFNLKLLQINNTLDIVVFTVAHIIFDGWSMEILLKEIDKLYTSIKKGEDILLEPLNIQFKDYSSWLLNSLHGKEGIKNRFYWINKFKTGLPTSNITRKLSVIPEEQRYFEPTYKAHLEHEINLNLNGISRENKNKFYSLIAKLNSDVGASYRIAFDENIVSKLNHLAKDSKTSLFNTLITSFHIFLYSTTGEEDNILATNVSYRDHEDSKKIIGWFVNIILIRSVVNPCLSFKNILHYVSDNISDALAHKIYPFERLLAELDISLPSLGTIFINMINFDNVLKNKIQSFESFHGQEPPPFSPLFDVNVNVLQYSNGIEMFFEYRKDLFSAETIEHAFENYKNLIFTICNDPNKEIIELLNCKLGLNE